MTRKAQFNAEEWSVVIEAPMLAGMQVLAASKGGTMREMREIARVYAEGRTQRSETELLDAVIADRAVVQPARTQLRDDPAGSRDESMARIRRALRIVDEIATADEANEYRRFIWSLADRTARAHKEGGFLGIGGEEISAEERSVLDELGRLFDEGQSHPTPTEDDE